MEKQSEKRCKSCELYEKLSVGYVEGLNRPSS